MFGDQNNKNLLSFLSPWIRIVGTGSFVVTFKFSSETKYLLQRKINNLYKGWFFLILVNLERIHQKNHQCREKMFWLQYFPLKSTWVSSSKPPSHLTSSTVKNRSKSEGKIYNIFSKKAMLNGKAKVFDALTPTLTCVFNKLSQKFNPN